MFSALICAPYQAPVFLIFFVKNSCHLEWFFPLNFHSWTYMANPNFATTEQVHFANGEHDLLSTVINQCVASARDGDDYNSDSPEASVSVADDSIDPITEAREQLMAANPPLTAIGESFVGPVSTLSENEEGFAKNHDRDGANFQLAIYIAMAHAGLVLATAICYGVCLLLKDYWTPIHWAILISMPLHRIQAAAFEFWKRPLQLGLAQAFFAIPAAMLFALLDTVEDIRETFRAISIRDFAPISDDAKFYKLFQWLFFLWTCLLCYEYVGLVYMIAVACVAGATYRMLHVVHSIVTAKYTNWVPQAHEHRGSAAQLLFFTVHASRWSNRGLAQTLIKNLSFLVALQLIVSMTLVILGGTILFSFKVSVETKDAVDALKSNLEAGKRFSDWLGTSPTSLNIDKYMMMAYDTVVQRVNDYAEESNMTTVAHAAKEFLDVIAYNGGGNPATDDKSSFWEKFMTITHVFAEKFGGGSMSGSYSILVGLGTDVANFVKQVLVFVAMLFFLITSENGGVMEQVLHMIPLSELTRHKCASVLDRTISAVLVTTGLVHVSPLQLYCSS
ncbi:uncharacterized protein [Physcomitrium patens]|uniref:uncharacterized protein isoform X3 n=1 Tax=Physcomitrium patens TaxID=3218 RepID=UPI000D156A1F|nr:uncharacterized protein LOC112287644 isoform X3 [Physcomitrium patens]|eukprot:XP_024386629.1 uncharacterized protein LOC112287644 isoform X3 [Physcomitrella patens]